MLRMRLFLYSIKNYQNYKTAVTQMYANSGTGGYLETSSAHVVD